MAPSPPCMWGYYSEPGPAVKPPSARLAAEVRRFRRPAPSPQETVPGWLSAGRMNRGSGLIRPRSQGDFLQDTVKWLVQELMEAGVAAQTGAGALVPLGLSASSSLSERKV